jgi:hypothetical protein
MPLHGLPLRASALPCLRAPPRLCARAVDASEVQEEQEEDDDDGDQEA